MDRSKANAKAVQEKANWRLTLLTVSWVLVGLASSGCATYQNELHQSISDIKNGRPDLAAESIKQKAFTDGDDQVVYLFEYGTAQQLAKNYEESNRAFLKAEELTDVKDYFSISRQAGSLLLNQGMVQYKGEDYEKVLINAMLAINFLALNNREDALVETRKVNDKLYKYKFEAKKDYQQNPFAFYLSAMIWEANRHWDDAYIDYKHAYELEPNIPYLKSDLMRLAKLSRRPDELEKWQKAFTDLPKSPVIDKSKGEIVLVLQQGWAPRKFPRPESPRMPKLFPVASLTDRAKLTVVNLGEEVTQTIASVQDVAIKTLEDDYASLTAKRIGGVAVKAVVADQLRQKNELLGQLAWIGMNLADRADLRQWVTLPQTYQVARISVPAGAYTVYAEGLKFDGTLSGERSENFEIKVKSGEKIFIPWRTLN